jgi:hypothetical protein
MKKDALHELQVAIVSRLRADADLTPLIGNRIYDLVPNKDGSITAQFPFVSFGSSQEVPEDADCLDASTFYVDLNVWSHDPGFAQARSITRAVKSALTDDALPLTDNALVYFQFDGRRDIRAPDGLTTQIVLTFRAGIDQ